MKTLKKITAYRIELENGHYCDITERENNEYDFWMYHKDYGTATYMFCAEANSEEEILELATANAPDYYDSIEKE
jgi:hypothetical protein